MKKLILIISVIMACYAGSYSQFVVPEGWEHVITLDSASGIKFEAENNLIYLTSGDIKLLSNDNGRTFDTVRYWGFGKCKTSQVFLTYNMLCLFSTYCKTGSDYFYTYDTASKSFKDSVIIKMSGGGYYYDCPIFTNLFDSSIIIVTYFIESSHYTEYKYNNIYMSFDKGKHFRPMKNLPYKKITEGGCSQNHKFVFNFNKKSDFLVQNFLTCLFNEDYAEFYTKDNGISFNNVNNYNYFLPKSFITLGIDGDGIIRELIKRDIGKERNKQNHFITRNLKTNEVKYEEIPSIYKTETKKYSNLQIDNSIFPTDSNFLIYNVNETIYNDSTASGYVNLNSIVVNTIIRSLGEGKDNVILKTKAKIGEDFTCDLIAYNRDNKEVYLAFYMYDNGIKKNYHVVRKKLSHPSGISESIETKELIVQNNELIIDKQFTNPKVSIYDILGKTVSIELEQTDKLKIKLPIDLEKGVYLLQILNEDNITHKFKFIVTK